MQARVSRNKLLQCLESVEPGVSPRDVIEQSSCVAFSRGWAKSYNDEVCCRAKSPLPADWTVAVPGKALLEVVRRLEGDDVLLSLRNGSMEVRCKREWAKVRADRKIALPVGNVEKPGAWLALPEDFCEGLAMVAECAAKEDANFALTCVHVTRECVEATDHFRMCRQEFAVPVEEDVLLRGQEAVKVAALGVVRFCETPGWLHFRNREGVIVSCRRYQEDYPELSKHFAFRGRRLELPKRLAHSGELASVFSRENADDDQVVIELKAGECSVAGEGVSGEAGGRLLKVKYKGPRIRFRLGPKLLAAIIDKHTQVEVGEGTLRASGGNWTYLYHLEAAGEENADEDEGQEEVVTEEAEV